MCVRSFDIKSLFLSFNYSLSLFFGDFQKQVYLTSRGIKNVHSPEISDELKQSAMRKWEQYMSDMKSILPARLWDAVTEISFNSYKLVTTIITIIMYLVTITGPFCGFLPHILGLVVVSLDLPRKAL